MLMMLRLGAASGKKKGPADAHDAVRGCGVREKGAQLMLMMLGVGVASGKSKPS